MVRQQEQDESMNAHFELNESLYAEATIKDMDTVCLWLGVLIFQFHFGFFGKMRKVLAKLKAIQKTKG